MSNTTLYTHYTLVQHWRWADFSPAEIACKGTGEILVNEAALDALQSFRRDVNVPVILNSAYRSEKHNKAVGGAPHSRHRKGDAFDVRITPKLTRENIHGAARRAGFTGFGDYAGFVHIDLGARRYWDNRT